MVLEDMYVTFQSLVVYLAMIKLLQFLAFNKRIGLMFETLRMSRKEILAFTAVFAIVYLAFCSVFYLLLHSTLIEYSNFLNVVEEAFSAMMGKFRFNSMKTTSGLGMYIQFKKRTTHLVLKKI